MTLNRKCVVIHNGSHRTVAGFSNVELPQCIIPSSYIKRTDEGGEAEFIFGTYNMIDAAAEKRNGDEVYTLVDSQGLPYNWDALEMQWRYLYDTQLKVSPEELPLVITMPATNGKPDMAILERYYELAFDKLNVPVFQIVIEPLAIALSMGKSSAFVIDIGASGCNVTPIIDGIVVKNAVVRSKFGGDFLDFQVHERLAPLIKEENDMENMADEQKRSTDVWYEASTWIQQFKSTMLQVSEKDLFELERYYKEQADIYAKQQEQLKQMDQQLQYTALTGSPNNPLVQKKNFLFKPLNKTLTLDLKECYQFAEYLFKPQLISDKFSPEDGLGPQMAKSVKKAGASINSMKANTSTNPNGLGTSHINTNVGDNNSTASSSNISPEQVYSLLLTNVIITGSTSLIEGMEQRIIKELSIRFPQYKLTTFANQVMMDRKIQGWLGALTMANLPSWSLGKWYSKEDYETLKRDRKQSQATNATN
ncbi:AAC_HP2_G0054650.mRNA.1.CDS.1 [Saccharomyces cerevisiae]|nr:AAC_HP2_G0054650.mRNA.1.CDS.1 [Saccharomyces cerevisiae]CAI6821315.1 AAC_HP2_G0054650.mRNA.1.CDS.1 [Saccharomyces cerevisiae]CAI6829767.1 AAC_HP1_G0056200.mRNA.1.CDS.1 [Saccharomyces cerevisiae]